MRKSILITGGAGGMGLATAKIMGLDYHVHICDVSPQRLDKAIGELKQLGISCDSAVCDITDKEAVKTLVKQLAHEGKLVSVIHTAGVSPQMADAHTIMKVNALGTAYITNACYEIAQEGFVLINIASMAAHMIPAVVLPTRAYPLAFTNPTAFLKRTLRLGRLMPSDFYRNGMAYGISKDFVLWLSRKSAARYGEKGARIISISPGSFDTEMGNLEKKSGSEEMLKTAALKRFGKPEEIAELIAFCASEKASYLTGTDILCDGGTVAGRQ